MNRYRPLARRAAAVVVSAFLGLATSLALASPAAADPAPVEVSGSCVWQAEPSGWLVTWTIASSAGGSYQLTGVTPESNPLEGIEPMGTLPAPGELVGTQLLNANATAASLEVTVDQGAGPATAAAALQVPADCSGAPEVPAELGQWAADCQAVTITIDNPAQEDLALTFVPSEGSPVNVEVAGGQSATVQIPASEGLAVDVQHQGFSIIDPAQPIELTPAAWADLGCEDNGAAAGDEALAATGVPTGLIITGAALLLVLGAGLFLVARRRRIIFTA